MSLYSRVKRMVTMFCTAIVLTTLSMLGLRLTVLSDMAVTVSAGMAQSLPDPQDADSDFPYKMNSKIYFSAPDADGEVLILNPETNRYLLSVNIMLPETKDSLYYTGALAPGTFIKEARLSTAGLKLKNGVYPCIAEIAAVDPDTMTKVASQQKQIEIYIGEKPKG